MRKQKQLKEDNRLKEDSNIFEGCKLISNNYFSFSEQLLNIYEHYKENIYSFKNLFQKFDISFPVQIIDLNKGKIMILDNERNVFFFSLNIFGITFEDVINDELKLNYVFYWKNIDSESNLKPNELNITKGKTRFEIKFHKKSNNLTIANLESLKWNIELLLIGSTAKVIEQIFDLTNYLLTVDDFKKLFDYLHTISNEFKLTSGDSKFSKYSSDLPSNKIEYVDGLVKNATISLKFENSTTIRYSIKDLMELSDFELVYSLMHNSFKGIF